MLTLACATVTTRPLRAQNSNPGWSSAFSVGTLHITRRDESSSPFRFSGRGAVGTFALEHRSTRYQLLTELQGASLQLGTRATNTDVQLKTGSFALSALRQTRESGRLRIDAGIETRAGVDITEHAFTVSGVAPTKYRFATLTFAPEIRAVSTIRSGTLKLRFTAPAFGWVDHPYSEVKSADNAFSPRFATVGKLRRVDADISYLTNSRYGMRAMLALQASALNYNDELPVRAVSNTISAGIIIGNRR